MLVFPVCVDGAVDACNPEKTKIVHALRDFSKPSRLTNPPCCFRAFSPRYAGQAVPFFQFFYSEEDAVEDRDPVTKLQAGERHCCKTSPVRGTSYSENSTFA